jgi:hypothetical protein
MSTSVLCDSRCGIRQLIRISAVSADEGECHAWILPIPFSATTDTTYDEQQRIHSFLMVDLRRAKNPSTSDQQHAAEIPPLVCYGK